MPEEIVEEQQEQSIADVFANAKPEDFKRVEKSDVFETPVSQQEEVIEPENKEVEIKEEPAKEEVKNEPVKEEVKGEPVKEEIKEEIKTEVKAPVVTDWREEIKKADFDEVLKAAGLDEFEIGLLKYRKETGDVTPYLEAKTVDYSKLTDEEIMRRDLRQKYGDLPADEFELLYQDEVTERFKLDPDVYDEQQQKVGKLKLKIEADTKRKQFVESQAKFKAPEKQPDNSEAEFKQLQAKWNETVQSNEATKALLESKRLVLGSKDVFNYDVEDPQTAIDAVLDNRKFWDLFADGDKTDFAKFYKVTEYAKNPAKYEKALIDYGKSLGSKKEVDELKNPSKPDVGSAHSETTGDFITDVGNAFLKKGVHKKS